MADPMVLMRLLLKMDRLEGELVVVPKGVIHRPRAEAEAKVLLIEPRGEPNTGDSGVPAAAKDFI